MDLFLTPNISGVIIPVANKPITIATIKITTITIHLFFNSNFALFLFGNVLIND
jgi:hypothetical protein